MKWVKGKVISQKEWANGLFSLFVEASIPSFSAGQFIQIALDENPTLFRPYSLVNAPHEAQLEFYYSLLTEGALTPALTKLKKDEPIYLAPKAAGRFILSQVGPGEILWLFATGTGLGPFISMLKTDEPWKRFPHIVLIHSVRYLDELTHQPLIQAWQQDYAAQFHWIPIVTRERIDHVYSQRIPSLLQSGALESAAQLALSVNTSQVMLCGNPNMVEEVLTLLQERALQISRPHLAGQIHLENYWKAK